jgi:hypothetical protein
MQLAVKNIFDRNGINEVFYEEIKGNVGYDK